jgi:hypothetical protein
MSLINTLFKSFKKEEKEPEHENMPEFQKTLITLSQIPGLEITGPGIHIKGPELKEDKK